MFREPKLVADAASEYGLDLDDITRWKESGYLGRSSSFTTSGYVFDDGLSKLELIAAHPEHRERVLRLSNSFVNTDFPELLAYNCFHETLDILCWLLRIRYASKDALKRRRFNLLDLLDAFIVENGIDLDKMRRSVSSSASKEKVAFFLKKGLYNELAYSYFTPDSYLNVGRSVKAEDWQDRFPSWSIVTAYYSVYEFWSSMAASINGNVNPKQHLATVNVFAHGGIANASRVSLFYPFNLSNPLVGPIDRQRGALEKHWSHVYARYPRDASRTIFDLEGDYLAMIAPEQTFIKFLYEFRVWANYTGIDTLLHIEDGALLAFLYRNLQTVIFFSAVMAELKAIALLGDDEFEKIVVSSVYFQLKNRPPKRMNPRAYPALLRTRAYKKHGLYGGDVIERIPFDVDPFLTREV